MILLQVSYVMATCKQCMCVFVCNVPYKKKAILQKKNAWKHSERTDNWNVLTSH